MLSFYVYYLRRKKKKKTEIAPYLFFLLVMVLKNIRFPDRVFLREDRKRKKEETRLDDELLLASLGYKQSLNRQLSAFSNFAISFGCCSVLSGLLPVKCDRIAKKSLYLCIGIDVGHNIVDRRNIRINMGLLGRCSINTSHWI